MADDLTRKIEETISPVALEIIKHIIYTLKNIAEYPGVHYTTINKVELTRELKKSKK